MALRHEGGRGGVAGKGNNTDDTTFPYKINVIVHNLKIS